MTTLTITLKGDLEQQIEQFASESGLSLEEAAVELLRRTADIRRLRALRKKGREYAKQAGVESEEALHEAVQEWREEAPAKAAGARAILLFAGIISYIVVKIRFPKTVRLK